MLLYSFRVCISSPELSSDNGGTEMPTEGAFEGHQEAVNAMEIHNGLLYTCSGDRTVRAFDLVVSGEEALPRTFRMSELFLGERHDRAFLLFLVAES